MQRKIGLALATLAATVTLLLGLAAYALTASLARTDGRATLAGLESAVAIELDARGIPRIRAESLADAFRAEGFVHAQERFFQMDLIRRSAAGELIALVGDDALPLDRRQAPFEFRRRARDALARLPARHRQWLETYAAGVNAGLADLGARPPEYWLLGKPPAPWTPEDSLLVVFAIYTMLSNNEYYELGQAVMAATLPSDLYDFLTPTASRYDRPLLAAAGDPTGGYRPAPLPAAVDFGDTGAPPPANVVDPPLMGQAASNQWAVDASKTAAGNAMLANDPHLGFQIPNLFYRAELYWPGHVVRGVSVPGLPGILIGANAAFAWGATVSYADQSDWVVIETDPADPGRYRTPDGYEAFDVAAVTLSDGTTTLEVRHTRYGPVVATDGLGRPLALKATWLEADGLSLDLLDLAEADSVAAARRIISRWSGPALSWSLAGTDGTVAWLVNGPVPSRVGFDGSAPMSWADGSRHWQGYRALPELPGGIDGIVYNANDRPLPLTEATGLSRMYMRPHRAARIADLLEDGVDFDELAFFRMQLDTTAAAYEPVRDMIVDIVDAAETDPLLAEARRQSVAWNGRADAASPAFLTLQRYYRALLGRVIAPLLAPAVAADPSFVYRWPLAEEVLLRIVEERPAQLLPPGQPGWDAFLRDVLRDALATADTVPIGTPWGESNRLAVGHPFAGLPIIGRWLRPPADAQPGSAVSIRVATPRRGAVFRLAVSPAAPENGILQLFGGQSGHFLSPHFMDQQADWAGDVPTPFLAGPAEAAFTLTPD